MIRYPDTLTGERSRIVQKRNALHLFLKIEKIVLTIRNI